MSVVLLKCYIGGDPFDDSEDPIETFYDKEKSRPASELNMMLRFTADFTGISGAYWCHDNWGFVGFNPGSGEADETVANLVLHELGHGFGASHEEGNVAGACGFSEDHADALTTKQTSFLSENLPIDMAQQSFYSIMYSNAVDSEKQRLFTDGGNVNQNSTRDNICVIGTEAIAKGWSGVAVC